jgi:hypothetical protein
MNGNGLDPDTAERMLRGEPAGPPHLARLLAAAAAHHETGQPTEGEEAALTAYRLARLDRRRRRSPALLSLKAALIGLALLLTGGVAMAATAHHLAGTPENKQHHHASTPHTSKTFLTHDAPGESVRPSATRPTRRPEHPAHSHPRATPHKKDKPRLVKGKASNPHKAPATRRRPSAQARVVSSPQTPATRRM